MVLVAVTKSGRLGHGMMVCVADNEQPDRDPPTPGTPARRPPDGPPPAPSVVPGEVTGNQPFVLPGQPPGPPPATAEQWQQYQDFQRFQEFQRGELPPARRRPLWLRVLLAKWFRRLVFAVVVVLAAGWAYQHYFGNPDEDLPASQTGGGKTDRTVLFATTPKEAVRAFYDNIAQNILPDACTRFETVEVEQQFARHFNAADCPSAVTRLNAEVGRANDYAEPYFPPRMDLTPRTDGTVVISSCAIEVRDGPRLGRFTVRKIPNSRGEQWTISRHEAEPTPCPTAGPVPTN